MKGKKKSKYLKIKKNKAVGGFPKVVEDVGDIKARKKMKKTKRREIEKYKTAEFELMKILICTKLFCLVIVLFLCVFFSEDISILTKGGDSNG